MSKSRAMSAKLTSDPQAAKRRRTTPLRGRGPKGRSCSGGKIEGESPPRRGSVSPLDVKEQSEVGEANKRPARRNAPPQAGVLGGGAAGCV